MDLVVRAFPLLPGKEQALEEFARDLASAKAAESKEFYDRFGVARETWHKQKTEHGTWVICVSHLPHRSIDKEAVDYARSKRGFDSWFKERVHSLTGIDPAAAPLGPPTECIFDTAAIGAPARRVDADAPTDELRTVQDP